MSTIGKFVLSRAGGSFITLATGMGLAFAVHAFMARLVGAEVYGDYFFALTAVNIMALVGKLGLDTATLRYVPAFTAHEQWGLARGFLRRVSQLAWSASIILALAVAGGVYLFRDRMNTQLEHTFYVACLVLPVTVVIQLHAAGIRALKRVVLAQLPPEVVRPAVMFMLVVVFLAPGIGRGAPRIMAVEFLSIVLALLVAAYALRQVMPRQMLLTPVSYRTKEWILTAIPLSLMSGLFVVLNQMGVVLVGAMQDTKQSGIFGVAARVATLLSFGLAAVNSVAAPMISELYWQGKMRELQRMLAVAAVALLVFSVPVGLGIIILGRSILSLFGTEFVNGYAALMILVPGQLVNSLAGSTGFLMTMTGHQKQAAIIIFLGVVLNLLVSVSLIPGYGMMGAAVATSSANIFWNLAMVVYVRRKIGVDSTILGALRSRS